MPISQVNAQQSLRATAAVAALRKNAAANTIASAPAASGRRPDAVTLSDTARALSAARDSASNASEVRGDRVAALKAAIADGSYRVDSRQLANSMVKKLAQ
jgi:negative regulator of flagellin synthesis FlgM